jgi:hypothetical protein
LMPQFASTLKHSQHGLALTYSVAPLMFTPSRAACANDNPHLP